MVAEIKALPIDSRLLYSLIDSVLSADDIDDITITEQMNSRFIAIGNALTDEFKQGNKVGERIKRETRRVKLQLLLDASETDAALAAQIETLVTSRR